MGDLIRETTTMRDQDIRDFISSLSPAQQAAALQREEKDRALTRFCEEHGFTYDEGDTAVGEWIRAHPGNVDWNLEEVKAILLRLSG
jgi:hypothetical protein